jgi:dTDP-4-dehydrorhamnose 3,5-epimerase
MAAETTARTATRIIASSGDVELVYPENSKGIGAVIGRVDSPDLIAGVRVQQYPVFPDDRGFFMEIQRIGHGLAGHFPPDRTQVAAAMNYCGTIKAFHFHLHQTDCWTPVTGLFQVALVDLRAASATFGARNTMYVGPMRPWQVLIPPGVAHGYKIIGTQDALLVYMTDQFYNPKDEGRLPYDDPSINYDWETQKK